MKVAVHRLPQLVKLGQVQQGKLAQLYDEQLNPGSYVMPVVEIDTVMPARNTVTVVDLQNGLVCRFNASTRCHVFHGASVVLDFVEGATG